MTEHRDDGRGDLRVGGWLPYPSDQSPDSAEPAGDGPEGHELDPPAYDSPRQDPLAYDPPGYHPPAYDLPHDTPANYRRPPYDEPVFGEVSHDEPAFGEPVFGGEPSHDEPAFGEVPPHDEPAFGGVQPYDEPAFGEPAFGGEPSHDEPAFGGVPPYDEPAGRDDGATARPDEPGSPLFTGYWSPAAGGRDDTGVAGRDDTAVNGSNGAERPTERLPIPVQRTGTGRTDGGATMDDEQAGRHYAADPRAATGAAIGAGAVAATGATRTAEAGRTAGTTPAGGDAARAATGTTRRRSTPGANDITQQLRMIPAAIAELPPVTLRGLPMFLAGVMALGAIAILLMMTLPGGKPTEPAPRATSTPTLGMPTIAPVLPVPPTGAVPTARTTTAGASPSSTRSTARRTTSPSPARVLLGALGTVEMSGYCQSVQAGGARLSQPAEGPNAAIDNWVCTGQRRNKGFVIAPTSVCRWKYGSSAYAAYLDINDAYSWRCYR